MSPILEARAAHCLDPEYGSVLPGVTRAKRQQSTFMTRITIDRISKRFDRQAVLQEFSAMTVAGWHFPRSVEASW